MPLSIRLGEELEKAISQVARRLHIQKSEVIRKCLKKFLSEVAESDPCSPGQIYKKLESRIPGSGNGSLSFNHREEVLKRIQHSRRRERS